MTEVHYSSNETMILLDSTESLRCTANDVGGCRLGTPCAVAKPIEEIAQTN